MTGAFASGTRPRQEAWLWNRPPTLLDVLDDVLDDTDGQGSGTRGGPLATGFAPLDTVLQGGLRPGTLTVLAGKPGRGKTITALQWARHIAASGTPVVFACFEHDRTELLRRLAALELGEASARAGNDDQLRLEVLLEQVGLMGGSTGSAELLRSDPLLVDVEARMRGYGADLLIVDSCGPDTLEALEELVARPDGPVALFVDYLQRVPLSTSVPTGSEQVRIVAERLKQIALRHGAAVVAVTAADADGLASRRLHLHHATGAASLAYEADVAIVLNDKLSVVSRLHLAYDTTKVYEFQDRMVFSVEKNRSGLADVHLEFRKDFASYRFHPRGDWVTERLCSDHEPES